MAQRYDIWIYYDTMETDKDDNGDWVKYDDHAAEITQLRAELAESRASEHGLFGRLETCRQDEAALKAELAAERELTDRLAETFAKTARSNDTDAVFYARESALHDWRTRRNK